MYSVQQLAPNSRQPDSGRSACIGTPGSVCLFGSNFLQNLGRFAGTDSQCVRQCQWPWRLLARQLLCSRTALRWN